MSKELYENGVEATCCICGGPCVVNYRNSYIPVQHVHPEVCAYYLEKKAKQQEEEKDNE